MNTLLSGRRQDKFGKNRTELSGPGGGPVETVTKIERVIVDPKQQEEPK